jgi:hypothetical protein
MSAGIVYLFFLPKRSSLTVFGPMPFTPIAAGLQILHLVKRQTRIDERFRPGKSSGNFVPSAAF